MAATKQQYIVNPLEGLYKDDKGTPVDAVVIYAVTSVIADVDGVATGIPSEVVDKYEHGFLVNIENFDIYSLRVDPKTGSKKLKKVE